MLFRAFQPQTRGQIKKVTSSDRSVPGFPATQLWTKPRARLSLKERRMRSANATKVHRKSGVAKWSDLLFSQSAAQSSMETTLPRGFSERSRSVPACRGGICTSAQVKISTMTNEDTFTYVEPELLPVLKELRRREPIFHT